ncbi:hypothetical protein CBR_g30963 [Chara braunii]|uniref:Uncharacterized protein n=1 Tax=Chara braunii TaxID=69332 RepID=A0A388LE61_CHABU|nr:hypothetical protein CBR_g30963 [Chara braunii]|eukprot:GBG80502.1 hypothetical protein CBR_g30963 [Chara braunii]
MEYRGIPNRREVGVGCVAEDEVQDVLDREGANVEGGERADEDDEAGAGVGSASRGPEGEGEEGGDDDDDVQELGASLQGGGLKGGRATQQTRPRATMDSRGKRRANTAPAACILDPKRLKLVRLDELYDPAWQSTFHHLFLQWWYIGGIPFERAKMDEYRVLTKHMHKMPKGMKPSLPQFKRIAGSDIEEECAHIVDKIRDIREQMRHTGATILTDGRKSLNSEPIVNFLAAGQSSAFLFTTVCREEVDAETADVVLQRWKKVFEKFGANKINVICTDSASVYVAAGRALHDDPDPDIRRIPWLPCSVHCCNLMLSDMVKDKTWPTWAIELLTRARAVVRFIRSHGSALVLFRIYSARTDRETRAGHGGGTRVKARRGRELLYPSQTRFASMYIMMERLRHLRVPLEAMTLERDWARLPWERNLLAQAGWVRTQVRCGLFWEEMDDLIDVFTPVMQLLRMLDQGGLVISCIFRWVTQLAEEILKLDNQQKKVAEMTLEYIYTQMGFDWRGERYRLVRQQLYDFHARGPRYDWGGDARTADKDTCEGPDETQVIADWWVLHGGCAPELCTIATRRMYTWVCASPAERNWALHERIHEKRRNRLEFKNLTDMVEMCANKKLLTCRQRRRVLFLPWGDLEEGLDDVPEPRRSGTLPSGTLTDEEIKHRARKMQRALTVRQPPSAQTVFGHRAAHIQLYDEEIEYEPPMDPQATDEMEAEAEMRSWDRHSHCEPARLSPPLTRGKTVAARGCKQSQVARSSSEDNRGNDGDVADDEDSDDEYMVDGEHPDPADEHGFDGGDDGGPCDDRAGGACLVTPGPGAVGGRVGSVQGFGLDVPQGSIPSAIFRTTSTLEVHPLQIPGTAGCDTTGAKEIGCTMEEVTAARLAAECAHGRYADAADGGVLHAGGHEVDRADGDEEDTRIGSGDTPGHGDTRLPTGDEGDGGEDVAMADAGGLLGCDRTELEGQADRVLVGVAGMEDVVADHIEDGPVTMDDVVAPRIEEDRQVDGAVVAAPVEAHVPTMSPLERHTVGIDPMMGRSRHILKRFWNVVPSFAFVVVNPPAPSGVSGHIGRSMEMADLFEQSTCQRVIEAGGVSWGAGSVAAGTRPACAGAVSGRGGESGGSIVGGGGGRIVVGGQSCLSGRSVGGGEAFAAVATAGGRGHVQGSPSPSSK